MTLVPLNDFNKNHPTFRLLLDLQSEHYSMYELLSPPRKEPSKRRKVEPSKSKAKEAKILQEAAIEAAVESIKKIVECSKKAKQEKENLL